MNRFEQKQKHWYQKIGFLVPIIAFLALFFFFIKGVNTVNTTTYEKQQESLETAISRSISQCYAVEGIYPPSLDYLKEHYGLIIDDEIFLVDYDYYGSNLLPDVTVLRKKQK